jgi:hypothetical protein
MKKLPIEIIYMIFEYLPSKQVRNLRLLSSECEGLCTKIIQRRSQNLLRLYRSLYKIKYSVYYKLDEVLKAKYYILDILNDIDYYKKLTHRTEAKFLICYNLFQIRNVIKFCEELI